MKKAIGGSILLIISAIPFYFLSCRESKNEYDKNTFQEENFRIKKPLNGVSALTPELRQSARIKIIPEYNILLTLVMDGGQFLAQAFSLDSCKYLRSFIKNGGSDGEQLSATAVQYIHGENVVYISDGIKKVIYIYSIDSILKALSVRPVDSLKIKAGFLDHPLILDKSRIIDFRWNTSNTAPLSDYSSVGVYNFFNRSGHLINYNGKYPATSGKIKVSELSEAFAGGSNLSDDNTRLVLAYYNTDIIDLSDTGGNLIRRIHGPDDFEPSVKTIQVGEGEETVPKKDAKFGYTGIPRMNKDILFVLYNGTSQEKNEYHSSRLYQFDSSLNPIIFYTLNKPIFDFDVDWSNQKIYALTHFEKGTIVIFKF